MTVSPVDLAREQSSEQAPAQQIAASPTPSRPRKAAGAHAVVQSIVSKFAILGMNAATGILTARALQPAGRGELAAMIIWSLFLASATTLGVPSSLIYYLRHKPNLRGELITNAFAMSFALGIAAAVFGAWFLPLWLHQYPPSVIHAAQWFLLATPLCSMTLAGRAILEASDEFGMSNAVQTLTPVATLLGLGAFLLAHRLNPYTAGIAYILATVPTFALMLMRVRRFGSWNWKFSTSACRLLLSYGVRSYGIDLLGTLALQVDQVLVVSLLSPSAMGSYVVVLSLSRMLNLFQNSVVMVLFPRAAGQTADKVLELTERSARLSTLVTATCGLFVCAVGPFLLKLLYGKEYVSAVGALRILVLEVTISGLVFVLAQAFMALARPGIVTILQGMGLALSIPMMLFLIPKWGVMGAAVSLLISTIARFLFIYVGFRVFLHTRSPNLVPRLSDVRSIAGKFDRRELEPAQ
jgi:O-antigen/teichoic acid export membrane protein